MKRTSMMISQMAMMRNAVPRATTSAAVAGLPSAFVIVVYPLIIAFAFAIKTTPAIKRPTQRTKAIQFKTLAILYITFDASSIRFFTPLSMVSIRFGTLKLNCLSFTYLYETFLRKRRVLAAIWEIKHF